MAKYRLTGPGGAKYEVTAPDEATEEEVLARFQKEVGLAGPAPYETDTGNRMTRRFRHQISMGLADRPSDAIVAAINTARGTGDPEGFVAEYGRQRATTKQAVRPSLDPTDIVSDTAGQTALAIGSAPLAIARQGGELMMGGLRAGQEMLARTLAPRAAPVAETAAKELTRKQIAQESGRVGAAFGSAGAAGKDHESLGGALADTATHTAGGYLLGRALPGAINLADDYLVSPIRNALVARKAARAERAAGVARDFEEAGIGEPPAYTMAGDTVRNLAAGLDDTLTGSSIRGAALPRIQELEAAIVREIEAAGGVATPAKVGGRIQEFLRNQVVGRSRTPEEIAAMTPLELYELSRVAPGPHYNPSPPRVAPGVPRDVGRVTPEQVLEEAALVPAVQPRAVTSVEGRYKEPTIADVELTPDLVKRVQDSSVAVADAQRRVQAEQELVRAAEEPFAVAMKRVGFEEVYASKQGDRWVAILHDETGTIPRNQRFVMVGADGKLQAGQPTPEQTAFLNEFLPWMQTKRRELYKSLDKSRAAAEAAEQERAITQREAEIYRVQQLPGLADRQRAQAFADAEAEAAAQASRDTQHARSASVDKARAGAVSEAARRTEAAQTAEAQRVAQETERRQAAANAEFQAQLAEARASLGEPIRLGQGRGQSYQTELDAAYEAARRNAPSVQRNPLGRKGNDERPDEPTNVSDLVERFALEGRRKGQQEGFKEGQLFDEDGRLPKETIDYLRPKLGDEVTDLLVYLSEHRAKGQLTPGMQGLQDMRTMVGQRIRQLGNDAPPELRRLYQAIDRDIDDFARGAGQRGDIYRTQREQIDRANKEFENDIKKPLSTVFGKDVDSAAALATLVKDTQAKGKIDRLEAFYRVLTDKGDRLLGTGWLLNDMARGGLEGFLAAYRGLSPDARRIMFQGPAAELGQRLDAMARAGGHLERYAKAARGDFKVDLRPSNVGAALFGYLNLPLAIKTAIGAEGLARLISSKWFGGWLKAYPVDKVPHSAEWKSHLARFRGLATETLGLDEATAKGLINALSFGTVQANPSGAAVSGSKPPQKEGSGSEWMDNLPRAHELRGNLNTESPWMPREPDFTSRDDNSFRPEFYDAGPNAPLYRDEKGDAYHAPQPYPNPVEGDPDFRQKINFTGASRRLAGARQLTKSEVATEEPPRKARHYVDPTPERRHPFFPTVVPRGQYDAEFGWPNLIMAPWRAAKSLLSPQGQYRPGDSDAEGVRLALDAAVGVTGGGLAGGALANRSGLGSLGTAGGAGLPEFVTRKVSNQPGRKPTERYYFRDQSGGTHQDRKDHYIRLPDINSPEFLPAYKEALAKMRGQDAPLPAHVPVAGRPEWADIAAAREAGASIESLAQKYGVPENELFNAFYDQQIAPGTRQASREPKPEISEARGRYLQFHEQADNPAHSAALGLERDIVSVEQHLTKLGKSPEEIAEAINSQFGHNAGITAKDIRDRTAWWHVGGAEDATPFAVGFDDLAAGQRAKFMASGLPIPPRQSQAEPAMFAGEGSRDADKSQLAIAKKRDETGDDRAAIWQDTGWYKGRDERWRYEIDDSALKLTDMAQAALGKLSSNKPRTYRLGEVIDHPALRKAYPSLMRALVTFGRPGDVDTEAEGGFRRDQWRIFVNPELVKGDPKKLLQFLGHEIQHAVQAYEGFEHGSPQGNYEDRPGEAEAYNRDRRRNYSAEKRKRMPPWETTDPVEEDQEWGNREQPRRQPQPWPRTLGPMPEDRNAIRNRRMGL